MSYVLKTIFFTFYLLLVYILVFSCIFYNSTINTVKFKSFVEVYPIEVNPIEVYPIEAFLIGKGVVEVSGCSRIRLEIMIRIRSKVKNRIRIRIKRVWIRNTAGDDDILPFLLCFIFFG
jgi:hypothetical protein